MSFPSKIDDLVLAYESRNLEKIGQILAMDNQLVNVLDNSGVTLLTRAAGDGNYDVVELLFKSCADPNLMNRDDRSALMQAATGGHTEIIEMFLKAGADLNF
jgi:ankyrin repeat protein